MHSISKFNGPQNACGATETVTKAKKHTWGANSRIFAAVFSFSLMGSNNSTTVGNIKLPLNDFQWSRTEPLMTSLRTTVHLSQKGRPLQHQTKSIMTRNSIFKEFHGYLTHSERRSIKFRLSFLSSVAFLQQPVSHSDSILHPSSDLHLDSIWGHQSHPDKC